MTLKEYCMMSKPNENKCWHFFIFELHGFFSKDRISDSNKLVLIVRGKVVQCC